MKNVKERSNQTFVVFEIDKHSYGLPVHSVDLVVRMVQITKVPGVPDFVSGIVNYHGEVIPVIDLRKRFGLLEKPVDLNDKLMIVGSCNRNFALIADDVNDVLTCNDSEVKELGEIFPELYHLNSVAKVKDGLILLNDVDHILSTTEHEEVMAVLESNRP